MKNSDHPIDEQSDSSIERLLADCDEALRRGDNPAPLLRRLDEFSPEARKEFQEVYESLISVRQGLSAKQPSSRFPRPFGKFRLLEVLGQGGFGLVFLAEDPELRRRVALKVPRLHQLVAPNAEELFLREAQMAANLEHPNLVSIYESGEAEGLPYLASAYCEGPTLARWLEQREELLSIREAAELVELLAQAMAHMHERRIVHRDLKPSNVLLFPRERKKSTAEPVRISKDLGDYIPKITDFGLAKPHDLVNDLSRTGIFLGTAAYVSPEQAWGKRESVGPSTDIYSLGVILYELLTGQPPFRGENELDTLKKASSQDPVPPRNLRRDTPRDLETICLKCLEKRPEKRYASMADLGEDLRRFLTGRPILAKPAGYIDKTNKLIRRQPWLTGVFSLAIVLMIAVAFGSYRAGRRENPVTNSVSADPDDLNAAKEEVVDRDPLASSLLYATRIQSTRQLRIQPQLSELKDVLATLVPRSGMPDSRSFEWYYLNNIARTRAYMPVSMTNRYISSDQKLFAQFDEPKKVRIMEAESGMTKKLLEGFASDYPEVHFTKDGSKLLTIDLGITQDRIGERGDFKIWNVHQEFELIKSKSFEQSNEQRTFIFSLASEGDLLFAIDRADNYRLWKIDLASGTEIELSIPGKKNFVVPSTRGDRILVKRDSGMELWNLRSMKMIKSIDGTANASTAAFSPDDRFFATDHKISSTKYSIYIYDTESLNSVLTFNWPARPYQIVFDQDSHFFALRFGNETIHLYDVLSAPSYFDTRDPLLLRSIPAEPSENVIQNPPGESASRIAKRSILPAETFLPPPLPKSEAWCSAFSPDNHSLIVGYDHEAGNNRETLKLWNVKSRTSTTLPGHPSTVMAVAFSPDGTLVASGGHDHTVRLWNAKTGKEIRIFKDHEVAVRALAFHPDSRMLASGDKNGIIKLWDCVEGKMIASWKANSNQVLALLFLENGQRLISSGNKDSIRIWRTSDQRLLKSLGDDVQIQGLALSPDETILASAHHQNRTVQLWDLRNDKLLTTIRTYTNKTRCVAFSPDGKTLVSGGDDHVIRFWNIAAGLETLTIPLENAITSLCFNSSGKTLTATLQTGMVRVFNGTE